MVRWLGGFLGDGGDFALSAGTVMPNSFNIATILFFSVSLADDADISFPSFYI